MKLITNKDNIALFKTEAYEDLGENIKIGNSVYKKEQINIYEEVADIPEGILPKYKYENNKFVLNEEYLEPVIEKRVKSRYTKDEFMDLFTDVQWVSVLSNENTDMNIKLFLMKFNNAPDGIIDIEKDKVKSGMQYMVTENYITQEDYNKIYGL